MFGDCSLNQDVHLSAYLHVTMKNHIVKDKGVRLSEGKFDVSAPNCGDHDYCWILHMEIGGVPLRKCIIWDVNFFINLCKWCGKLRESIFTVLGIRMEIVRRQHVNRQEARKYRGKTSKQILSCIPTVFYK